MLCIILIILSVVIVAFVIVVAMRPTDFRVSRSAVIAAAPSAVFGEVNDLHQWKAWSPWARMDPDVKMSYEGPAFGAGAIYGWEGKKTGVGRMTTLESLPPELIRIRLDFFKPFTATNLVEFTFAARDGQTLVTWSMTGKNNFVMKAMGLFMNFDKMCGDDFEKGLGYLKEVCEAVG